MLEKRQRINLLYDFYGEMLTQRQQEILEYYYKHDLSLGEISQETDISRQAAHDILGRSEQTLEKMEDKLGLYRRHVSQEKELRALLELLEGIERQAPQLPQTREAMLRVTSLLEK